MTADRRDRMWAAPGLRRALPGGDSTGQALVRMGFLSDRRLREMTARTQRLDVRLPDALRLGLALPGEAVAEAEAGALGAMVIDPVADLPDPDLVQTFGADICAREGILPWRRVGGTIVVLTCRPEEIARHRAALTACFGQVSMAVTTETGLHTALKRVADHRLTVRAETRVADAMSSRSWSWRVALATVAVLLVLLVEAAMLFPRATFVTLTGLAILTLLFSMMLKFAVFAAYLAGRRAAPQDGAEPVPARLPTVSILVPLFRERAIAGHLLHRLWVLDYPRELLDICLIMESGDLTTRNAIAAAEMPPWIRVIVVPEGTLKTKPRALNYALDFARGSIIGVYDAEDAPAPDQIRKVVARFAARGADVACLQGILDFYNARSNWLARCFTLEYATWFRIMLPGLERLGLVVPLGGTTLFFRRAPLEELGGWDAHNVTEDADLGLRLARAGYRTELIDTVTAEEANCRAWPWVKQRSRWLKGYGVTYFVHMRRPWRLWRELGPRRFFGVQVLFAGTLLSFALAPLLWSFWLLLFGLGHPFTGLVPGWSLLALGAVFLFSELLNITAAMVAVRSAGKPDLMKWAPSLHLYFPLAVLACYKALAELVSRPFFWDKTAHGLYQPPLQINAELPGRKRDAKRAGPGGSTPPLPPPPRPGAAA